MVNFIDKYVCYCINNEEIFIIVECYIFCMNEKLIIRFVYWVFVLKSNIINEGVNDICYCLFG